MLPPGFFFSSRRRHTTSLRDWSSDVCSSDLSSTTTTATAISRKSRKKSVSQNAAKAWVSLSPITTATAILISSLRSEERRVGNEGRSGWGWGQDKENCKTLGRRTVDGGDETY